MIKCKGLEMQIRSQLNLDRQVRVSDKNGAWRERGIVAVIPSRARVESYIANSPVPHFHGHALRIVTGAQKAASIAKSRAITMFAEIMLFFVSTALAGLIIGILLGGGFIPAERVPTLLFLTAGLLLCILGVVLASLLFWSTQDAQERSDQTPLREIVIPT